MSEQDLHGDPLPEPVEDAEAAVDELDVLEDLGARTPLDIETPEADAVEQRTPPGPDGETEDDYPPH